MAQTLDSVQFGLTVTGTVNNILDLVKASAPLTYAKTGSLVNGTGASQADRMWSDQRTIAASGTDDLDLNGTALQDALGTNLALLRIKLLAVYAATTNTNNVVMGVGTNPVTTILGGTTPTLNIRPGGLFLLTAPDLTAYGVTAATADILRFANSGAGTSVTYDIVIIGASA